MGIVFGILNNENDIDIQKCNELLIKECLWYVFNFSYGVRFSKIDSFISMEKIIDLGFDRILTSGKETKRN